MGKNGTKTFTAIRTSFQSVGCFQILFTQTNVEECTWILIFSFECKAVSDIIPGSSYIIINVDLIPYVLAEMIKIGTALG